MSSKQEALIELAALSTIVFSFIRPTVQIFCAPLESFYCESGLPSIRCRLGYFASVMGTLLSGFLLLEIAKRISGPLYIGVVFAIIALFGAAICIGFLALFSAFFKELLLLRSTKPLIKITCFTTLLAGGALEVFVHGQNVYLFLCRLMLAVLFLPSAAFILGLFRFKRSRSFSNQPSALFLDRFNAHPNRVVFIVFDELDQRLAFDGRPSNIHLPAFDDLFKKSLFCTRAFPPSRCTEISIPALLTGRLIKETIAYGCGKLALHYVGTRRPEPFETQQTIFHKLFDRSLNTSAIIGYHPLPRILGSKLVDCLFTPPPTQFNVLEAEFMSSAARCFRSLFETPSHSLFGTSLVAQAAADRYIEVMNKAEEIAGDHRFDFSLIHLPIPHAPYIFDSSSGVIGPRATTPDRYLDNLLLADKSLARLMNAVDTAPCNTTVIVTSDHWWRHSVAYDGKVDRRVPLAIHFPGQVTGHHFAEQLNTVSLHDLALEIVDGGVSDVHEAERWLKVSASRGQPTKL